MEPPKSVDTPDIFWLANLQENALIPAEQALNQQWIEQHQANKARITKVQQADKLQKKPPSSETNSSPKAETTTAPANSQEITSPLEPEEN